MTANMTRKRVIRFLGVVLGVFLLAMAAWIAIAGPVTIFRILRYGDTDIDDFSHYPGRELRASESAFHFDVSESELTISAPALTEFEVVGNLDKILEDNDSIAFLVLKGDTILYERYYQGHSSSSISQIFSISKSLTSALIGMAISDGILQSADQAVTDYIPELIPAGFRAVSFRDLLTMTSGSSYLENDNPFRGHVILNFTPELENKILDFSMERKPGDLFRYKSGDNALLGLALSRALGQETITAYTQRRIWEPLGMQDQGVWTIDHQGDGLEKTWCCLAASARDLAKFGRLYLGDGSWNGRQLLAVDWVRESTSVAQIPGELWPSDYLEAGWRNYGFQWWLASQERGDFFALGKDGQFLYLNPEADLTIVRLGWSSGDLYSSQWIKLFQVIADELS